jgi:hypothetical protein
MEDVIGTGEAKPPGTASHSLEVPGAEGSAQKAGIQIVHVQCGPVS